MVVVDDLPRVLPLEVNLDNLKGGGVGMILRYSFYIYIEYEVRFV